MILPQTATVKKITGYTGTTNTTPTYGDAVSVKCRFAKGKINKYSGDGIFTEFDVSMHTDGKVKVEVDDVVTYNNIDYTVQISKETINLKGIVILQYILLKQA